MKIVHALAVASTLFGYCGNGEDASTGPTPRAPDEQVAAAVAAQSADPHTVYVFTDFECPYCKKHDAQMRALAARRPDLKVVIRHKPLPMHDHARIAAKAAVAAENQGQLDAYAKVLFDHQDALDRASLQGYAADLGLDRAAFDRDLDDAKTEARIATDEAAAKDLGIRGTPTSLVGVHVVEGALPIAEIERHLP